MEAHYKLWDRVLATLSERKGKPMGDGIQFETERAMSLEGSTPSPSAEFDDIPIDKFTKCHNGWHAEEQHIDMFCPHCGARGTPESLTAITEVRKEFFNWYESAFKREADITTGSDFAMWDSYKAGYFAGPK